MHAIRAGCISFFITITHAITETTLPGSTRSDTTRRTSPGWRAISGHSSGVGNALRFESGSLVVRQLPRT